MVMAKAVQREKVKELDRDEVEELHDEAVAFLQLVY
jgi:hypothetical protein